MNKNKLASHAISGIAAVVVAAIGGHFISSPENYLLFFGAGLAQPHLQQLVLKKLQK